MKKALGVTRKLDELGRIVFPIELRRSMNIKEGTKLEIHQENDEIILSPESDMLGAGMYRAIDELGRIVLPIEMRRFLDMQPGTSLEFFTEGNRIVLRRYQRGCIFCGSTTGELFNHKGKLACLNCIDALANFTAVARRAAGRHDRRA